MTYLIITICITLLLYAFCSLTEAAFTGAKHSDIEAFKKLSPRKAELAELFIKEAQRTTLSLKFFGTGIIVFGAALAGILFTDYIFCAKCGYSVPIFSVYMFPIFFALATIVAADFFARGIGAAYRVKIGSHLIYPLYWIRIVMRPLTYFAAKMTSLVMRGKVDESDSDDEIMRLAERGAKDGLLTTQEKNLIANALSLDDTPISEIMTPRTVVMALDESATVGEVFADGKPIPFGRMPVYRDTLDNIVGIVRRRDLLMAKAKDQDARTVQEFAMGASFVPENGNSLSVLRQLIRKHQHMGIAVDEYGSLTGVVTLEDIFEHLLGSEIFETDDMAVDMRELALKRKNSRKKV